MEKEPSFFRSHLQFQNINKVVLKLVQVRFTYTQNPEIKNYAQGRTSMFLNN